MGHNLNSKNNGFTRKKFLFTAAGILILIIAVFVAYQVLTSRTARETYLKAEGKNIKNYAQQIKSNYAGLMEEQKPYLENTYKSRLEISADIMSDDDRLFGVSGSKAIMDVLRKCKLILNYQNSPATSESLTNAGIVFEKAPLLDATMFTRNKQVGITVPILLPGKYFTINADNLDNLYDKLNIPVRPKRIVRNIDIANTLKFSDAELDNLIKDYGEYISSLIEDRDVKYGNKVEVNVGQQKKTGREVTVDLNSDKTGRIFKGLLEKIAGDDTLLKLTFQNYAGITSLLDEEGIFQMLNQFNKGGFLNLDQDFKTVLDTLSAKKDINSFRNSLKDMAQKVTFPDGFKMTLVIDSSNNILDRQLKTSLSSNGQKAQLDIHMGSNDVKNDGLNNGFYTFSVTTQNADGGTLLRRFSINSTIKPSGKNGDQAGKSTIEYLRRLNGNDEFSANISLDISKKTDKSDKINNLIKYDIGMLYNNTGKTDKISGQIDTTSWKNDKKKLRDFNTNLIINANMPSINLPDTSFKISIAGEDKFNVTFKLPEVKSSDTIDLNKVTDSDIKKIEQQVMGSFGQFYTQNQPVMDAVLGK